MNLDKRLVLSSLCEGGRSLRKISVKHYWKGGTPGWETDWNQPLNWYNRNVPGWFDEVVIAKEHTMLDYYPVIQVFANDIAQLVIEEGGRLIVAETGRLSVDGLGKKGLGIINEGEIFIQGEITVHRTTFASVRNKGLIYNTGSFAIDRSNKRGFLQMSTGSFVNLGEMLYI